LHLKDLTPPGGTESHWIDLNALLLDHSWTMRSHHEGPSRLEA
jgi:hypothetical protein